MIVSVVCEIGWAAGWAATAASFWPFIRPNVCAALTVRSRPGVKAYMPGSLGPREHDDICARQRWVGFQELLELVLEGFEGFAPDQADLVAIIPHGALDAHLHRIGLCLYAGPLGVVQRCRLIVPDGELHSLVGSAGRMWRSSSV